MSIAVAVQKNGRITLGTDSQTSFGASRMPVENLRTTKMHAIGGSLMATTGWGLYENILDDYLARFPNTEFGGKREIFNFFMGFWRELRDHYTLVKEQCDKDDESPFANLDAAFLVVNKCGIYHVGSDMSVTRFERYYAIGSGGDYSLGAVEAIYAQTSSTQEICQRAVEVAIAFDVHCGGPVQLESLDSLD
jgi:ATP-dependent HslUV protease subunit HslV